MTANKPVLFRVTNNLKMGGIQRRLRSLLPNLLPHFDVHVVTYKAKGIFYDELAKTGVQVHHIPFKGNMDPKALAALRNLFQRFNASIVHTHSFGGNISGLTAAALAGVPVRIGQVHRCRYHWHRRSRLHRWKQIVEESLLHRLVTDKVLFVSQESLEYFRSKTKIPPEKLLVLHNGIELESSDADLRPQYGIDPGQIVIGFVGRIGRGKGFDRFMEICTAVLKKDPASYTFVVIGDGGNSADWKRKVKQESFGKKILFLGEQQNISAHYNILDLLIFPSEAGAEGMPGVVLEAAHAGLPILARQTAPIEEIRHYYSRINFIHDHDVPEEKIAATLHLPPTDSSAIQDEFSMKRMIENTVNLYTDLLKKNEKKKKNS